MKTIELTDDEIEWLKGLKKRFNILRHIEDSRVIIPEKERQEKIIDGFFEKVEKIG